MRTATTIEASSGKDAVEFAVEAERLGLDVCWVAEAWGADAPSPLGYLAARTERMLLGSGVIQIGTRSPVTLALTGEIADGWLGTSFIPERADAYFEHLDEGLARAGRTRASLDICQGAEISLVTEAELAGTLASRKKELAFSLGGMGTATANFYNDAYSRQGWAEVAAQVRDRWQAGDRNGAAALVTDDMVLATTLIGTEDMVRARLRAWREAGVDTVRLYPAGDTLTARLDTLARGIELVRDVTVSSS